MIMFVVYHDQIKAKKACLVRLMCLLISGWLLIHLFMFGCSVVWCWGRGCDQIKLTNENNRIINSYLLIQWFMDCISRTGQRGGKIIDFILSISDPNGNCWRILLLAKAMAKTESGFSLCAFVCVCLCLWYKRKRASERIIGICPLCCSLRSN